MSVEILKSLNHAEHARQAPRPKNELYRSIIALDTAGIPTRTTTPQTLQPTQMDDPSIGSPSPQPAQQRGSGTGPDQEYSRHLNPPSPPQFSRKRASPAPEASPPAVHNNVLSESTDTTGTLVRMRPAAGTPPIELLSTSGLRVHGGLVRTTTTTRRRRFATNSGHLPLSPLVVGSVLTPNPSMYGLPSTTYESYESKLVRLSYLVEQQHRIEINWFWDKGSSFLLEAAEIVRQEQQHNNNNNNISPPGSFLRRPPRAAGYRPALVHDQEEYVEEVSLQEISGSASTESDTRVLTEQLALSHIHNGTLLLLLLFKRDTLPRKKN